MMLMGMVDDFHDMKDSSFVQIKLDSTRSHLHAKSLRLTMLWNSFVVEDCMQSSTTCTAVLLDLFII